MAIKLIAIDIRRHTYQFKTRNHTTSKGCFKMPLAHKEVYVVLCTGRPYPGVEGLLQELDLVNDHDYVVTYNGTFGTTNGFEKSTRAFLNDT